MFVVEPLEVLVIGSPWEATSASAYEEHHNLVAVLH